MLNVEAPDLDEVEWPEPAEGDEDLDPLFSSKRGYVQQIDRYKKFQVKATVRKPDKRTAKGVSKHPKGYWVRQHQEKQK
jgi:hypothetical protein